MAHKTIALTTELRELSESDQIKTSQIANIALVLVYCLSVRVHNFARLVEEFNGVRETNIK